MTAKKEGGNGPTFWLPVLVILVSSALIGGSACLIGVRADCDQNKTDIKRHEVEIQALRSLGGDVAFIREWVAGQITQKEEGAPE